MGDKGMEAGKKCKKNDVSRQSQTNGQGNRCHAFGRRVGQGGVIIDESAIKHTRSAHRAPYPEPVTAMMKNKTKKQAPKSSNPHRPAKLKRRPVFLNVKRCETIEELIRLAHGHGELAPRNLSAFWSRLAQLVANRRKNSGCPQGNQGLKLQIKKILEVTMEGMENFNSIDLSEAILGMAKVVKHARATRRDRTSEYDHGIFQELLLCSNLEPRKDLFQLLAKASAEILPTFDARHLSNLAYAYAVAGYLPVFDDGSTLFDLIEQHALICLEAFKPQELSNLVWAFTKVGALHSHLFKKVVDVIEKQDMGLFEPQGVANIAWAYASAGEHNPALFNKLEGNIIERDLQSFKPQDLSNVVWAYATAGEANHHLFDKVANAVNAGDLKFFFPQALSNIVWAYATARETNHPLFNKIADAVTARDLRSFTPQDLSSITWAYATAGEWNPRLFDKVAGAVVTRDLGAFDPQALSNIAWAYARAGEHNPRLFNKVEGAIIARDLRSFEPQALSNIVWAYATAGVSSPRLFKKVGGAVSVCELRSFRPQDFSNIAWAFATAKQYHPRLFGKFVDAAIAQKSEFSAQETANLLWAYAATGRVNKDLFSSFIPTVTALIEECNSQSLANIAWAFAVSNVAAPDLFDDRFIPMLYTKGIDFLNVEDLSQLHQWQLWQLELQSNVYLPSNLQQRCFRAFTSDMLQQSDLQNAVVRGLRSIGLHTTEEVLLQSGYRLDAVVDVYGQFVGIEVDGPSHFNTGEPTGNTILKRRQVFTMDEISIVSVPYWEWDRVRGDCTKKHEYLCAKLGLLQNAWCPAHYPDQRQTAELLNVYMPYSQWAHWETSGQKAGFFTPQA